MYLITVRATPKMRRGFKQSDKNIIIQSRHVLAVGFTVNSKLTINCTTDVIVGKEGYCQKINICPIPKRVNYT